VISRLKTQTLKAVAARLSGHWQSKLEAQQTAKKTYAS